ncbi:Vacuolar protein sorting-associated protein 16-li ke protein [Trichuris trichiura]|uniref:Vacuolar protein sorting-associated protein 16 homolog n=1 Tax=Trichuris trichiura TaxID=36087 RepID=A0A077ZHF2_TRITR|nr:Vacuolar protein sorting-associated protein 16-li ke protein [Trichuris trichiura]
MIDAEIGSAMKPLDIYCEFCSAVGLNVRYFLWCGNEAVFLSDSSHCTFTGMDNESLSFSFDSSHAVCQEIDGIRVFSSRAHEFFCLVHPSLSQIFSVGSLSPAAFLFIAYMEYTVRALNIKALLMCTELQKKNYNAYEYVRMIQNQMHEAVLKCIEAAENSFDPPTQKKLLKAASFGKVFAPDAEVARYTSTCRILRTLNNLRQARCAIPLTYYVCFFMFQDLTFVGLIEYLVECGEYSIAVACCRCLRVNEEEGVNRVVMHWATENVRNESLSDDLIVSQIRAKSAEFPNLSKAAIAEIAVKFKRTELAAKLLNYEGNLASQVLMLMTLGRKEKALARAAQSKDPELICFVILKLIHSMEKLCDFDLLIRNFEIPFTLYKLYIREDNPQQLKYVFEETDDFLGQAEYHLKRCVEQSLFDVTGKIESAKAAQKCFAVAKDDFFTSQMADYFKLLNLQAEMEEKYGEMFVDCSLRETVKRLFLANEAARAEEMQKQFKISDSQ